MNLSILTKGSVTGRMVLTEAKEDESKYDIDDEVFGEKRAGAPEEDVATDNPNEFEDVPNDDLGGDNGDPIDDNNEFNEDQNPDNQGGGDDLDAGTEGDNLDGEQSDELDDGSDLMDPEDDDSKINDEENQQSNINSIPKLEILNLSPRDRKLCNIELLEKFNTLSSEAQENLNNNIITMATFTPKEAQIVKIVSDNIAAMIKGIEDYILYKYDDIYEENVMVYHSFCKRYRDALSLIEDVVEAQGKRIEDKQST